MRSGTTMGKLVTIFLLAATLGALANGRVITVPGASSGKIAQPLHPPLEKISQDGGFAIMFWLHEIGTGPNKTVWNVGYSENTLSSPSSFGLIQMIDSPLTNRRGRSFGRVQGTISYADLHKTALSVNFNVIFTDDIFHNGSTLQVQGRISVSDSGKWRDEELSIVGGTGSLSEARGTVISSYQSFDPSTLHRQSSFDINFVAI